LNPQCHVSKQDMQDLWQKIWPTALKIQQSISSTHGVLFYPCVHQTHLKCLLPKKAFFFHLTTLFSLFSNVMSIKILVPLFGHLRNIQQPMQ